MKDAPDRLFCLPAIGPPAARRARYLRQARRPEHARTNDAPLADGGRPGRGVAPFKGRGSV